MLCVCWYESLGGSVEGTLEKGYIDPLVRDHWLWHATTKSCFTRPSSLSSLFLPLLFPRSFTSFHTTVPALFVTYFSCSFFSPRLCLFSSSFRICMYIYIYIYFVFYFEVRKHITLSVRFFLLPMILDKEIACTSRKDSDRCRSIDVVARSTMSKILLAAAMLLLLSPLNVSLIDPCQATLPYDPKFRSTSFFCVHCHLIDPTGIYFSRSQSLRFLPPPRNTLQQSSVL